MRRTILARAVDTGRVEIAQRVGGMIRRIVAALDAPRPANALARHQLAAIRQKVAELERDLDARERAGLAADDIVTAAARTHRALFAIGDSPTRQAAHLAMALDVSARLAVHGTAAAPPWLREDAEPFVTAIRAQGIGTAALAVFALHYPDLAVKIDRASLDRLVIAWTAKVEGGRWPTLANVWHERVGTKLSPVSIKNEMAKLAKSLPFRG